jgi:hypothetical protein
MKSILILLTLTVSATAADKCYTAEGKRMRCIDAPPSLLVDNRQAAPIRQMPDKLSGNGPQGYPRSWRASKDFKPVAGTIGNALAWDVIQTEYYQPVVQSP